MTRVVIKVWIRDLRSPERQIPSPGEERRM
jgi:hypothetical protein